MVLTRIEEEEELDDRVRRYIDQLFPGLVRDVPDGISGPAAPVEEPVPLVPTAVPTAVPTPMPVEQPQGNFFGDLGSGLLGLATGDVSAMNPILSRMPEPSLSFLPTIPWEMGGTTPTPTNPDDILSKLSSGYSGLTAMSRSQMPLGVDPIASTLTGLDLGAENLMSFLGSGAVRGGLSNITGMLDLPGVMGAPQPGREARGMVEADPHIGMPEGLVSRDGGPGIPKNLALSLMPDSPYGDWLSQVIQSWNYPKVNPLDVGGTVQTFRERPWEEQLVGGGYLDFLAGSLGKFPGMARGVARLGGQLMDQVPEAVDFISDVGRGIPDALALPFTGLSGGGPGPGRRFDPTRSLGANPPDDLSDIAAQIGRQGQIDREYAERMGRESFIRGEVYPGPQAHPNVPGSMTELFDEYGGIDNFPGFEPNTIYYLRIDPDSDPPGKIVLDLMDDSPANRERLRVMRLPRDAGGNPVTEGATAIYPGTASPDLRSAEVAQNLVTSGQMDTPSERIINEAMRLDRNAKRIQTPGGTRTVEAPAEYALGTQGRTSYQDVSSGFRELESSRPVRQGQNRYRALEKQLLDLQEERRALDESVIVRPQTRSQRGPQPTGREQAGDWVNSVGMTDRHIEAIGRVIRQINPDVDVTKDAWWDDVDPQLLAGWKEGRSWVSPETILAGSGYFTGDLPPLRRLKGVIDQDMKNTRAEMRDLRRSGMAPPVTPAATVPTTTPQPTDVPDFQTDLSKEELLKSVGYEPYAGTRSFNRPDTIRENETRVASMARRLANDLENNEGELFYELGRDEIEEQFDLLIPLKGYDDLDREIVDEAAAIRVLRDYAEKTERDLPDKLARAEARELDVELEALERALKEQQALSARPRPDATPVSEPVQATRGEISYPPGGTQQGLMSTVEQIRAGDAPVGAGGPRDFPSGVEYQQPLGDIGEGSQMGGLFGFEPFENYRYPTGEWEADYSVAHRTAERIRQATNPTYQEYSLNKLPGEGFEQYWERQAGFPNKHPDMWIGQSPEGGPLDPYMYTPKPLPGFEGREYSHRAAAQYARMAAGSIIDPDARKVYLDWVNNKVPETPEERSKRLFFWDLMKPYSEQRSGVRSPLPPYRWIMTPQEGEERFNQFIAWSKGQGKLPPEKGAGTGINYQDIVPDKDAQQEFLAGFEDPRSLKQIGADFSKRAYNIAGEVLNTWRAFKSSYDLGWHLRQGALLMANNPKEWAQTWGPAIKALRNEEVASAFEHQLLKDPIIQKLIDSGTFYAKRGLEPGARESQAAEQYVSTWASKIPGVPASERAFTVAGNATRWMAGKEIAERWMGIKKGNIGSRTIDRIFGITDDVRGSDLTDQEWQDLSKLLNYATGRGPSVDRWSPATAAFLNRMFYSFRLQTSRFAMPLMLFNRSARVRKEAARMLSRYVGLVTAVLGLFWATPGVRVELNPKSNDFGKLQIGRTSIDVTAGYGMLFRAITQIGLRQRKANGEIREVNPGKSLSMHVFEELKKFYRTKASPGVGFGWTQVTGADFLGRKVKYSPTGITNIVMREMPMFPMDILEGLEMDSVENIRKSINDFARGDGVTRRLVQSGMSGIGAGGFGTSTYPQAEDIGSEMMGIDYGDTMWPFEIDQAQEYIRAEEGGSVSAYNQRINEINDAFDTGTISVAQSTAMSPSQKRNWYHDAKGRASVARAEVARGTFGERDERTLAEIHADTPDPKKRALEEYYYFINNQSPEAFATGRYNREMAGLERFWASQGGDVLQYVLANTNTRPIPDVMRPYLSASTKNRYDRSEKARRQRAMSR